MYVCVCVCVCVCACACVCTQVPVPILFIMCTQMNDVCRKPQPGMWHFMCSHLSGEVQPGEGHLSSLRTYLSTCRQMHVVQWYMLVTLRQCVRGGAARCAVFDLTPSSQAGSGAQICGRVLSAVSAVGESFQQSVLALHSHSAIQGVFARLIGAPHVDMSQSCFLGMQSCVLARARACVHVCVCVCPADVSQSFMAGDKYTCVSVYMCVLQTCPSHSWWVTITTEQTRASQPVWDYHTAQSWKSLGERRTHTYTHINTRARARAHTQREREACEH